MIQEDYMLVIVSTSLRKESNSRALGREALSFARRLGIEVRLVDLIDFHIPLCDGGDNSDCKAVKELDSILSDATAILFCSPIYNYDVSPALRNLLAHVGSSLEGKVAGVLCSAGGDRSYLAPLAFMNSVMAHFRCLVLPRYVYAPERVFENGSLKDSEIQERVHEVVHALSSLAKSRPSEPSPHAKAA